ncbi:MAG: BrnA antitoxin family protein [Magnetococcales bacterium]|nr:BrnA antitoxin family protein [Magnetococcales bacterium]
MHNTPDPEKIDAENPEWSNATFHHAKPAQEVLRALFPPNVVDDLLPPKRGRPCKDHPKQAINIRLSPEVITSFRATGKGWQTRIDNALREWLATHGQCPPK